jgi:hypothetical protein
MPVTPLQHPAWSDADTEAMFATVGRYVIIFQLVEGTLDEILLLGWGYENWADNQAKLARLSNCKKVNELKNLVLNSPEFARVHTRPDWCADFKLLIGRLHDERARRNSLVHSQYLFEFVDAGLPPLRSHRKKVKKVDGEVTFDQQHLTKAAQEKLLSDLAQLAVDVNFTHVQLIHDYKAPTT